MRQAQLFKKYKTAVGIRLRCLEQDLMKYEPRWVRHFLKDVVPDVWRTNVCPARK